MIKTPPVATDISLVPPWALFSRQSPPLARAALGALVTGFVVFLGALTDAVDLILGGNPSRSDSRSLSSLMVIASGHDGLPVGAALLITAFVFAYLASEQHPIRAD